MALTIYTPDHYKPILQTIYDNLQTLRQKLQERMDGEGSDALDTKNKTISDIESSLDSNLKSKLQSDFGLTLGSDDKITDVDKVKVDIAALKDNGSGSYSEIDNGQILKGTTTDLTTADLVKNKGKIGAKIDADGDGNVDTTAALDIDVESYTSALRTVSDYEKTMKTLEENLKAEIDSLKTKVNDTSNSYIDNAVSQLKAQKSSVEDALGTISDAVDNYIKVASDGDGSGGKESFKTMIGASDEKFSTLKQAIKDKIKNILDFENTNTDNSVTLSGGETHKLTIAERFEKIRLLIGGGKDENGLFGDKGKEYYGYIDVLKSYLDMKNNQSGAFEGLKSELDGLSSQLKGVLGILKSQYGAIIEGGDSQISVKDNSTTGNKEFELTKENLEKLNGKLADLINKGMDFENVRNAYILVQAVSKIVENLKDKLTSDDVANMDKSALNSFKTLVGNIKNAVDNLLKDSGNLESVANTFKTNFASYVDASGKGKVSDLKSNLENNFDSSVQLSSLDIDDTIEKPGDKFDDIKQAVKDAVNNTDGEKYITDDIDAHNTKFEKYDNWLTFMGSVEDSLEKYQQDLDNNENVQKVESWIGNWGKVGGFDYYIEKQAEEAWDTFAVELNLPYFNSLMSQAKDLRQQAAQYNTLLQEALDNDDWQAVEQYQSILQKLGDQESSIQGNLNAWFNNRFLNKDGTLRKTIETLYGSLDSDDDGALDTNAYSNIIEKYEKEALLGLYGLEKELISQIEGKLDTKPDDNQLDAVSDLNTLDVKLGNGTVLSDLPADLGDIDVTGDDTIDISSSEISIDLTV